eukprot:s2547_g13.t1
MWRELDVRNRLVIITLEADDGDEDVEEEEEEEETAESAPKEEDEDEEVERPKFKVAEGVVPEYGVLIRSSELRCKARIFDGDAKGPASEEDCCRSCRHCTPVMQQDGTPSTAEFFLEQCGLSMLPIDVDNCSEEEAFQAVRIHMESKVSAYLKELVQKEAALREQRADEEESRRKVIARNEAAHLEAEAQPLRQYLMAHVVPTLTAGLTEVCKEQPEDPIEFLAQYLLLGLLMRRTALAAFSLDQSF